MLFRAQSTIALVRIYSPHYFYLRTADENVRWSKSVAGMREKTRTLMGDVMLASSFVSYISVGSARAILTLSCVLCNLLI
jgi:hypothetical protein